jgi:predicted O-linked N-acetylglucosamine transferase (SPINDLY family)
MGRLEDALADYDRAIALNPSYAFALCNRGTVLERLGRWEESLASYDRAIEVDSEDSLTYYNRGSVLKELKRFEEALTSYDRAVELRSDFVEAHVNRGNVLQELRRHEAAIASFDRAIELKPVHADVFHSRGVSLYIMKRFGGALADFDRAIELKSDGAEVYFNRGNLMLELQRYDAAVSSYLKAIELSPGNAEAHHGLGETLVRLKQYERAVASFDQALALNPDRKYLIGVRRAAKMQICDWDGLSSDLERISEGVKAGKPVCDPLTMSALIDSPELQRLSAQIYVREECPPDATLGPIPARARSSKIRIGYFSSDFRIHPVALLTAGLFEHHDRSKFEVTAFAFGPESSDAMRVRLERAFDRFIDVRQRSDVEVAAMARDMGIDIAVDLNGITEHSRSKIFALRAAPIQIGYLGFPGTTGAEYMDYLIGDSTVIPREHQAYYTERIIYLRGSFMPFDSAYKVADITFTRVELGLPADGFVFCCFNNTYKITPAVFDSWMKILARADGSVLWLSRADRSATEHLRNEASQRGVDGRRLIFADRMASVPEHLARLRAADLFLDTSPYNAHSTALDALWAGLPVLTRAGRGFASSVAASLLQAVGLRELVTESLPQYEALAASLAADPDRVGRIRRVLADSRVSASLFDTARYTKDLEGAYEILYRSHQSGAEPDHVNGHLAFGTTITGI